MTADPSYESVCSGLTGHAEVVQVRFDPAAVSYREVLEVFFGIHDPTTKDRQGHDIGTQYRSVIFTHDEEQAATAAKLIADLEEGGVFADPIVTEVQPLERFWPAEDYHRQYYRRNPAQPYCLMVGGSQGGKIPRALRRVAEGSRRALPGRLRRAVPTAEAVQLTSPLRKLTKAAMKKATANRASSSTSTTRASRRSWMPSLRYRKSGSSSMSYSSPLSGSCLRLLGDIAGELPLVLTQRADQALLVAHPGGTDVGVGVHEAGHR